MNHKKKKSYFFESVWLNFWLTYQTDSYYWTASYHHVKNREREQKE